MTDLLHTGIDAYFYPTLLGDEGDRLRIDKTNTTIDVPLDEDLYTTIGGTSYQSIFTYLSTSIDGLTLAFERSEVGKWTDWGTRLIGDEPFSLDTNDPLSHRVLHLLGFPVGQGSISASDEGGTTYVLESPYPYGLCWRSPVASRSKASHIEKEQYVTGGHGAAIQPTVWGSDHLRLVTYPRCPAVHVRRGRGTINAYANVGDLPVGSVQNNIDDLWAHGVSTFDPIYAGYHLDEIPMDWTSIDEREQLRSPVSSDYASDLSEMFTEESTSSERYTVSFVMRVEDSKYGQG